MPYLGQNTCADTLPSGRLHPKLQVTAKSPVAQRPRGFYICGPGRLSENR